MKNISREDYIIWDKIKNEPVDKLDVVYHFTTIIELINEFELSLQDGEELRCVAELPIKWQELIDDAIEKAK